MDQKTAVVVAILMATCVLFSTSLTHAQEDANLPICGSRTSCKWIYYAVDSLGKRYVKQIIENTKCTCTPTQSCVYDEKNISLDIFIYRCKEEDSGSNSTPFPVNQTST